MVVHEYIISSDLHCCSAYIDLADLLYSCSYQLQTRKGSCASIGISSLISCRGLDINIECCITSNDERYYISLYAELAYIYLRRGVYYNFIVLEGVVHDCFFFVNEKIQLKVVVFQDISARF